MHVIGIRAAPKQVTYAILRERDDASAEVVDVSVIVVPAALEIPDRLRHIRTTFLDLLTEYEIAFAALRLAEVTAQNVDHMRIGIEAVLQEAMSSSPVRSYVAGGLARLSGLLRDVQYADMKKLIANEMRFPLVDNWETYKSEERESLLAAAAALELLNDR